MKNKEKKRELLENGKFKDYSIRRKEAFSAGHPEQIFEAVFNDETGEVENWVLSEEFFQMSSDDLSECENMRKNKQRQVKKIRDHIAFLMLRSDYDLFFITFNFSDEILDSTKKETRKKKIISLMSQFDDYIINIDYSPEKDREHYHVVAALKSDRCELYRNEFNHDKLRILDKYNYGFYDLQKISRSELSGKRLSQYISKLTLHSVKVQQQYVSVKKGSDYQKWKVKLDLIKVESSEKGRKFKKSRIEELNIKRDYLEGLEIDPDVKKVFDLFGSDVRIE